MGVAVSGFMSSETSSPRPGRIRTRQDFARELTALREQASLTVRQVDTIGPAGADAAAQMTD